MAGPAPSRDGETRVGADQVPPSEWPAMVVGPGLGPWRDLLSHRRCPAPHPPDQDHGPMCRPASRPAAPPWPGARPVGRAASRARPDRERERPDRAGEQIVQFGERGDHPKPVPELAANRKALEVPGHVLAQIAEAVQLVGSNATTAQRGDAQQPPHFAERRERLTSPTAGERVGQIAEQPRPAEAAAADDDPIDSGLSAPSAAHRLASQMSPLPSTGMATWVLQRRDRLPVGLARVGLLRRSAVQGDSRAAGLLRDPAGIQKCLVIMVDADPGLDRDGYGVACCRVHGGGQDHPQPVALVRQRRATALAGDLRHRAAEVQVHVVHAVLACRGSRWPAP